MSNSDDRLFDEVYQPLEVFQRKHLIEMSARTQSSH